MLSHSVLKSGRVVSAPSLHRESTDSLIVVCEVTKIVLVKNCVSKEKLFHIKTKESIYCANFVVGQNLNKINKLVVN